MNPIDESHAFLDRFLDAAKTKSAELGRPVTCKKGCFHCCREPVWVEIEEARNIAAQFTGEARERLKERVQIWWDQFMAGKFNDDPPTRDQNGKELMHYLGAGIWCPLLQDGLCSVYEQRPTGCRMFNAIGKPSRCADLTKRPHQKFMETDKDGEVMATALGIQCQRASKALFQNDHLGVWLAQILLGKTERSNSAQDMLITQTDPS